MNTHMHSKLSHRLVWAGLAASAGLFVSNAALAQSFDSGSNGEDGAFVATPPAGSSIVEFDPRRIRRNNDPNQPLIDPERDNVFHFTTITIPSGVTLRMSARWTNGPVYLLAAGLPNQANSDIAVRINGTIDLSGENGADMSHSAAARTPAIPGPGGYYGGLGGNWVSDTSGSHGQNGLGPFGGLGAPSVTSSNQGTGATQLVGGPELVPLVGGSGGGGGNYPGLDWFGGGGGAGGGALLIASSKALHIESAGRIYAGGGYGGRYPQNNCAYFGGGAAGGSVRLVAPVVTGTGAIDCWPGYNAQGACVMGSTWIGAAGRVRIEAFQNNQTFNIVRGNFTYGSPLSSFVPSTPPPTLQVLSVDGQTVATEPTGSFDLADVTINNSAAVEIRIQARNVPVVSGSNNTPTVPTLFLSSLEGRDLVLDASKGMTALSGDFASSIATVSAVLPSGFSRGYVRASWTVP
jgi:hypothetical protein